ncbi:MAG: hypothetical protein ACYTFI_03580, partial [Planctomycetota bacterium]
MKRKRGNGVVNGVQRYRYDIVFAVKQADGEIVYWVGCVPDPSGNRGAFEVIKPVPEALEGAARPVGAAYGNRFRIYSDLALAIQCHTRGWDRLARAFLVRSNRRLPQSVFDRTSPRPRDPGDAVALMAWNYWCNRFVSPDEDRRAVLARLRKLSRSGHGLDAPFHMSILEDMEKTLAPTDTAPGSAEALVDALRGPHKRANYRRLRDMGLEAVPVLIDHLVDYRLTRAIQSTDSGCYVWHVRISDVVADLLNGLYGKKEGFSYDFLQLQGRGKSLDRRHVLHWWNSVQGAKALDYLLENAITMGRDRQPEVNESILAVLGQQHPGELVKLVGENLGRFEYVHDLLDALAESKATSEEKNRLYLLAASAPEWRKRTVGIRYLFEADHPKAAGLLIEEIRRIPDTPAEPYWVCAAGSVARIAHYTQDRRAWTALKEAARRVDVGQRLQMIQQMTRSSTPEDPHALEFLVALLEDRETRTIPPLKI